MNRQVLFNIVLVISGLLASSLMAVAAPIQLRPAPPGEYHISTSPILGVIPRLAPTSEPSFTPAPSIIISATSCHTYYFHSDMIDVGADGLQRIATLTAPTGPTDGISFQIKKQSAQKIASFYSDPVLASNLTISGSLTGFFWTNFSANNVSFTVNLFAYDPATGQKNSLGSALSIANGSGDTKVNFLISQPPAVPAGHRLLLDFYAQGETNADNGSFLYDDPGRNSQFTLCQPTPPAPILTLDKEVVPANVKLGGVLTYTIRFRNLSGPDATGSVVSDTLPVGTQFISAKLNNEPVTPNFIGSNTFRVPVNSTFDSAGVVAAGQSGTLVVQTKVSTAFIGSADLQNVAAISSTEVVRLIVAEAVATIIIETNAPPAHKLYLPFIFGSSLPPAINTSLYVRSVNTGRLNVRIQNPAAGHRVVLECAIANNTVDFCGNFFPIGTYKMIAFTTRCGVLEGTFHDADVGPVTRTVFCN